MSVRLQGGPARGVGCLLAALAQRLLACGSAAGLLDSPMAPSDAGGRGRVGPGQAGGRRVSAT